MPAARRAIPVAGALLMLSLSLAVPQTFASTARPAERPAAVSSSPDPLRTNWDSREPGLSPATVASASFGQLFSTPVNGPMNDRPIVADGTVVVGTGTDRVYGLDAVSGRVRWKDTLGRPVPQPTDCNPVGGTTLGVLSSPVFDHRTGRIYLVAEVNLKPAADQPQFDMFAIDVRTGTIVWKAPIGGAPSNDPGRPFNPATEMQRPDLLRVGDWVYAAFGSRCEVAVPAYDGYVVGVNTVTHHVTMWTDEVETGDGGASIWQAAGGLMSDGPGRLFFTSGNGTSPAPGPGASRPANLAESVVRLGVLPGGRLATRDFFSPSDAPLLDLYDTELGSSGPVGLPFGTSRYPHLLVQAGKDGRVFLLDRGDLGGRARPGHADHPVAEAGPFTGVTNRLAVFGGCGGNDYVYYIGQDDYLRALRFSGRDPAHPTLTDVANTPAPFAHPSGPPVVTSDGRDPRSAVVWDVYKAFGVGVLEAFDAVPRRVSGGLELKQIWSAPVGLVTNFDTPTAAGGKIYLATNGNVMAFGPASKAPLTAVPANFHPVALGSTGAMTVSVAARATVTVRGISTTTPPGVGDPFTAGRPTVGGTRVTLPVTLRRGQRLDVPVTFKPTVADGTTGALSLVTGDPRFPAVNISLFGPGTKPGFFASASLAQPGFTPVGSTNSATVFVVNGGASGETVSSVVRPGAPFAAIGLPAPGTVIGAGQSFVVTVTYTPVKPVGNQHSSFTIKAAHGTSVTVAVKGFAATGTGQLKPTPKAIDFGSVPVGRSVARTIDLSDAGTLPLSITSTTGPAAPFGIVYPIAPGQPIDPVRALQVTVTFTPARAGAVTGAYRLTATDGAGPPQVLTIKINGTGAAPSP
ncbi:MAG TPA: choice-of-anchor D domain-containing protein [Streptosporangiaceae bacterium]|nr:choice-of-anchor D domain-containing protein [Streptosporangiaceae bacterium]